MRVTRRCAVSAVVAVLLGGSAVAAATASATPSAWTATVTKAVNFKGVELGATPSSTRLHLTLALSPRNSRDEAQRLRAIYTPGNASYHHYLTPRQWEASYAPTAAAVTKVTQYLRAAGFTGVEASGNRLVVTATGTAAQAEHAFKTDLANFKLGGRTVFGNTTAAHVPTDLAGTVQAVIGLNDLPLDNIKTDVVHPAAHKKGAGAPDVEGGLYPAQFEHTYDAVGTRPGKKTAVAILTEGDPSGVVSSLRYAERKEHHAKVPVTVVRVGAQSKDTSGADEFDMDSQTSTMDSGGVKRLYMYNLGSLVDAETDADFAAFVSQDKATALSASIGGCEINAYLDGSEVSTDEIMQEGAMQGQSLFASSGDNGDACMYVAAIGAPAGVPGVNWPASGEFDTGVGGTSLISDAKGNRIQELAWVGSGGGFSYVENAGWWTEQTDVGYAAGYVSGGRAVPDVALDADPNVATPEKVYVGKTISYVGGTSLSSPMMLGFWARLESAHHNKLGLASIPLYQQYDSVNPGTTITVPEVGLPVVVPSVHAKPVPGFTDIEIGDNGIYPAQPGYDLATGLGAPDVKVLDKVIK